MQVWDSKQNKLVDITDNQYASIVGSATAPNWTPTDSTSTPAQTTSPTDTGSITSSGSNFLDQEQNNYKMYIQRAVQAQDSRAADTLAKEFKTTYGFDVFGEAPQTTEQKQRKSYITQLQRGPTKIPASGGISILGARIGGTPASYQYVNPNTGQIETTSDYKAAVDNVNNYLAGLGGKTITGQPEAPSPTLGGALYNLTLKPLISGAKEVVHYGELIATAAGTLQMAATSGTQENLMMKNLAESQALVNKAKNTTDPTERKALFDQAKAIDQRTNSVTQVNNWLAKTMAPVVMQRYDNPKDTIINGVGETLTAVGTVAQGYYLLTAPARLMIMNAEFNAGLYGTGELIKEAKGEPSQGLIPAITGYTSNGPVSALFGDNKTTQFADNIVALTAPILWGTIRGSFEAKTGKALPGATPEGLPGETPQKGLVPEVRGSLYKSIAVAYPKDLIKNEATVAEMLRETPGDITRRSMAITLKSNVGKAGKYIDSVVAELDKRTGVMSGNDITGEIEATLRSTPEGSSNPKGVDFVMAEIKKNLNKGIELPGGSPEGITDFGTTNTLMNNTRKILNSNKEAFFRKTDIVTPADKIKQLEWMGSNAIKDQLGINNDQLQHALDIQHTSLSMYPKLSQMAQGRGYRSRGATGMLWNALRGMVDYVRIPAARAMSGEMSPETRAILSGETPPSLGTQTIPPPTVNPEPAMPVLPNNRTELSTPRARGGDTSRWTTSQSFPQTTTGTPANINTLTRDMRYRQGTWVARGSVPPEVPPSSPAESVATTLPEKPPAVLQSEPSGIKSNVQTITNKSQALQIIKQAKDFPTVLFDLSPQDRIALENLAGPQLNAYYRDLTGIPKLQESVAVNDILKHFTQDTKTVKASDLKSGDNVMVMDIPYKVQDTEYLPNTNEIQVIFTDGQVVDVPINSLTEISLVNKYLKK